MFHLFCSSDLRMQRGTRGCRPGMKPGIQRDQSSNKPRASPVSWSRSYLFGQRSVAANNPGCQQGSPGSPHCVGTFPCINAVDRTARSLSRGRIRAATMQPSGRPPGPRARYPAVWPALFGGGECYCDYRARPASPSLPDLQNS
jgi:hypothetical protein